MPYFYVSRCKVPSSFVSQYAVAGVMDAPDLETAKVNLAAMLALVTAIHLDSADAYEVRALDEGPRSKHGAVAFTFVQND